MMSDRTVKSFEQDLVKLRETVVQMGRLCIKQIESAVRALAEQDLPLAEETIARDEQVNALQRQVDDQTLRMLALRQPMADDLRSILASGRMASDLERIADYAVYVAKRARDRNQEEGLPRAVSSIVAMSQTTRQMLQDIVQAYLSGDSAAAVAVWHRDDEVDRIYTELFVSLREYMKLDPDCVKPCLLLLQAARAMERIGDHITNLAEQVQFQITGDEYITKQRAS